MKIGDEVYVHGYVDEIRKDTVIIRNDGGYFGTVPSEVVEQVPKRGKWILGKREWEDNYIFSCSQCWHSIVTLKTQKIPYCWFCGAKMESDEK